MPFFGVGKYVPEGNLSGCSFDYLSNDLSSRIFILVFFVGAWLIPMIVILFAYVSIIRIVAHSSSSIAQIGNQGNSNAHNKITIFMFVNIFLILKMEDQQISLI